MQIADPNAAPGCAALSAALAVMGKTARPRFLALLMTVDEPLCACELPCGLRLPEYEVSRHLRPHLRRAVLVASSCQGLRAYRLGDRPRALRGALQASVEELARLQSRLQRRVAGRCVAGPALSGTGGSR